MFTKSIVLSLNKILAPFTSAYNEERFLLFFRVAIPAIAILDIFSMWKDFPLLFSTNSTVIPQELIYLQTEYFQGFNVFYEFLQKYGMLAAYYKGMPWLYLVALLFLMIGILPRVSAVISLLCQILIFRTFASFNYGYDYFLSMSLFYCIIFPVGKYNTVQQLLFRLTKPAFRKFNYKRVLQIHLCIVYFFSGLPKALDTNWWNGNSIWKAVSSLYNNYSQISPVILAIAGIGVILLELTYPVLIFNKFTRKIVLFLIIAMHVGIGITIQLYSFAAIMIVWNICAFSELSSIKNNPDEGDS
jgi:hypothetical protein